MPGTCIAMDAAPQQRQQEQEQHQRECQRRKVDAAAQPDTIHDPVAASCICLQVEAVKRLPRTHGTVKAHDLEVRRQQNRRVCVLTHLNSPQHALMNNGAWLEVARLVAVVARNATARIIHGAVLVGQRLLLGADGLQQPQPGVCRFGQHPVQGNVCQALVRIAAADIGMHARKPDLFDALAWLPEVGVEHVALIGQGQRVNGVCHAIAECAVRNVERPDHRVDEDGEFVDGHSIGGHRIPDANEVDLDHLLLGYLGVPQIPAQPGPSVDRGIADHPGHGNPVQHQFVAFSSVRAKGRLGLLPPTPD